MERRGRDSDEASMDTEGEDQATATEGTRAMRRSIRLTQSVQGHGLYNKILARSGIGREDKEGGGSNEQRKSEACVSQDRRYGDKEYIRRSVGRATVPTPCQPWSRANPEAKGFGDDRAEVFVRCAALIDQ